MTSPGPATNDLWSMVHKAELERIIGLRGYNKPVKMNPYVYLKPEFF